MDAGMAWRGAQCQANPDREPGRACGAKAGDAVDDQAVGLPDPNAAGSTRTALWWVDGQLHWVTAKGITASLCYLFGYGTFTLSYSVIWRRHSLDISQGG